MNGYIDVKSSAVYRQALENVIPQIPIPGGRILVTGATGLIGSCLIDLLLLANELGMNFELFALGRSKEKLADRFAPFLESSSLHFFEQDIRKPIDKKMSVDYIVHGASYADPRSYALYPVETMLINVEGTKNVLEYCRMQKACRMLLLSTFEVYGNNGKDVYSEDDFGAIDENQIRSCYPESKRCAEILTRSYTLEYGINASIARLCSIYGPTMLKDDSKAHAQFLRKAIAHESILLKSKGNQRRTYCHVIDAVMGILYILIKGEPGEAYNISNDKSVASIKDVAETLADIAGTKVETILPDEIEVRGFSKPQNCILDNTKLRSLGWQGEYTLRQGMEETLAILS